jgi:hypothetical protein
MWRGTDPAALDIAHDASAATLVADRPSGPPTKVPHVPARVRVALVALGAALVPAPASAAVLTHTSPLAHAAQSSSGELSPTPPVKLKGKSKSSPSTSSPSTSSSSTVGSPLPDTGADLPTTALLGLGLLVCGIGLRMRTVDERIF